MTDTKYWVNAAVAPVVSDANFRSWHLFISETFAVIDGGQADG
jgi:hypothetical protein